MDFRQLQDDNDYIRRTLRKEDDSVTLAYIKSVCDEKKIAKDLIAPFYEIKSLDEYKDYLYSFADLTLEKEEYKAIEKMFGGSVVIFWGTKAYAIKMDSFKSQAVSESTEENILQGPKNGLNENLDISLNLIRNRYRHPELKVIHHSVGRKSKTKIAMLYDHSIANQEEIDDLKDRLDRIQVDVVQAAGQLQKYLTNNRWNIFPTLLATERPDRIVRSLAEGKIVLMIEGTSWALIGPAYFFDFFKSMDDTVELRLVGKFLISLRYIALLITLFLPAMYVAVISYSPDILKVQFVLLIAGNRTQVPFPSYLEILFMMLMAEFLIEASIRLPQTISPTATTVGGLILGQSASAAGLVANVMIVVISAVAISVFVIPVNAMHQAIRIIRYPLILLGSLFGMIGVLVGAIALLAYLSSLRSLNRHYLQLFSKS
ncbi:spore germination protein [Paenibacillus sp. VMFN-D1]|uniref:spore germination protein n=1 Tax=Paenibacillus sp. VMFN-D1 TaxID=2135608 RepID=UPI000E268357|nr:spore germination protein [Paenibacillus sp. VMFN-D1]RED37372.1 spore germination protein [Paenibacillus sp. VMFN-D1]